MLNLGKLNIEYNLTDIQDAVCTMRWWGSIKSLFLRDTNDTLQTQR